MKLKRFFRMVGTALLLGGATMPTFAATPCGALATFTMTGHDVRIDKAQTVAAGLLPAAPNAPPGPRMALPEHCRVDGVLDQRTGRNGKPYAIGFAIAMPVTWNGRFFFQGGGGLNGAVNAPLGSQFSGGSPALSQGFAVVSTDSGHKGTGFDASFFEDQEAALNFLYQAVAQVTVVAKEVVTRHYGNPAHHSYFVGCSTGGREAMMMSQRFPRYFDGIVAGAPATRTGYSNLGLRSAATALNEIAPRDAQGRPQTNQALSELDRKLVTDGLLAACDANDGVKDGLVFAPQSCRFDPQVLACQGAKTASCLSTAQVAAVNKVMTGPQASDGREVYPGYYYDTGITNTRGLAGVLVGPTIPEGPTTGTSMNVDVEAARAHGGRSMVGDTDAWTNLSSFHERGGKLLFFHGVSDPWFSARETVRYYELLGRDNGPTPIQDWSRLFLVPGMAHCSGGDRTPDQFNMVEAIVNWVENGRAPQQVIATGSSMQGESRPLCPYPAHAHFNGSGDARSAASYSCRE